LNDYFVVIATIPDVPRTPTQLHPCLNHSDVTIVSDQDKGSIAAIAAVLPNAFHFHCSWHRRQNITKRFGNRDGIAELSANWMFNVLSNCKTHREIKMKGDTYYHGMKPLEAKYLTDVSDAVQYPAARCAMGPTVCMYGRSASSGVESMNHANKDTRHPLSVDCLVAAMTQIRLESGRYEKYQKLAWNYELPLTPRGMETMETVYSDVVPSQYARDVREMATCFHCTVCRTVGDGVVYTLSIPKQAKFGSFFGTCNCGIPRRDGIPCRHMAVLADARDVPNPDFTRLSVMPYWFRTEHWQKQYPRDVHCNGAVNLRLVMSKYDAEDDIRYCPEWLAPKKAGRPKKNQRILSVADHISSSTKKRRNKFYCSICNKFNHNTVDCYQHPMNMRTQEEEEEPEYDESDIQMGIV
jgi:hypothetical protein